MDIQKTMEFILEQNAATAANLQQFSIEMKELKAAVAQHAAVRAQNDAVLVQHEAVLRVHEEDLQVHTEWKIEMSQALQDLAGQMKDGFRDVAKAQRELTEAHQATEESLNILIRTVQDILPRLPKQ